MQYVWIIILKNVHINSGNASHAVDAYRNKYDAKIKSAQCTAHGWRAREDEKNIAKKQMVHAMVIYSRTMLSLKQPTGFALLFLLLHKIRKGISIFFFLFVVTCSFWGGDVELESFKEVTTLSFKNLRSASRIEAQL